MERAAHVTHTIRIMTWNVHGTFNLNPEFDLEGVCSIIRKWSPDVVALQEVDLRGRNDDVFARLADTVGDHRVEARSIVTEDGDYGQVLLSRWPFAAEPEVTDVSYQEREPRRAISARILAVGEVTVVATHLGLSIHERYAQAHAMAGLVDAPGPSWSATSTTGSGSSRSGACWPAARCGRDCGRFPPGFRAAAGPHLRHVRADDRTAWTDREAARIRTIFPSSRMLGSWNRGLASGKPGQAGLAGCCVLGWR